MRVPGIIVARTDAEAATFLDNCTDERDQPFILGATNLEVPSYRVGFLAILQSLHDLGPGRDPGPPPVRGARRRVAAGQGLAGPGRTDVADRAECADRPRCGRRITVERLLDAIDTRYSEVWQAEAGLKTYGEAVGEVLELRAGEGERSR